MNTAKTGMDLDSPIFKAVREKMIKLMRTVIDFLNDLHTETKDYKNDKIKSTPLTNAIERAEIKSFEEVRNESYLF
jgi:hypothetical protein